MWRGSISVQEDGEEEKVDDDDDDDNEEEEEGSNSKGNGENLAGQTVHMERTVSAYRAVTEQP